MTQPAKSQEPSMEEILASIRRIIADDDATKTVVRAPEPVRAEPPPPPPQLQAVPPASAPRPPVEAPAPVVVEEPSPMVAVTVAEQASDILDLTESMAAEMPAPMPQPSAVASPSPAASQFRTIDASPDVGFDDFADKAAMQPAPQPSDDRGGLLSNSTSAAVDNAFNALAQTVLAQNARTLEDLVREMLRPMLKTWLDDNLPGMVERLVRAEIERVSRGRAG